MNAKKKSAKGTSEKELLELVTHTNSKIISHYTHLLPKICFDQEEQCRAFSNEMKESEQPS